MEHFSFLTASLMLLLCQLSSPRMAEGAFVFYVFQNGQNVQITGSGTIDTAALTYNSVATSPPYMYPATAVLVAGPSGADSSEVLYGASGPANFGSGSSTLYPTGTGDVVGTSGGYVIDVPVNYVSGAPLSVNDEFTFQTITSLHLIPGTYVDTWGSGPTADSLTINIGVVPEPASAALIAAPVAIAALRRRRRHLV